VFNNYIDSDDSDQEYQSDRLFNQAYSFFARESEKKNKSDAIKTAEAAGDATALKELILNSALRGAQCTGAEYFRSYFDTSVTNNSPHHPLLGDLRILATEIEAAYRPELHGLNLVAFTIRQYTSDYVEQLTTANNMSAHSSLNP
jgi:hypothetical protein